MPSFREFLTEIAPSWLSNTLSGIWLEIVHGTPADLHSDSIGLTHRMGWLLDEESPDDALPLFASERGLPRYINETAAAHRARLHGAWNTYQRAGSDEVLVEQIEAAGYVGARVYTAADWPTRDAVGHWSQFWVFFPTGSHPVTGEGPAIGTFTVGDGTTIGPVGITASEIKELRAIVRRWKPSRWVCRQLIFQIDGWTIGDGGSVGDPGLEVGGTTAYVGV